jgi:hypothetical protein
MPCSVCRGTGHNKTTCPNKTTPKPVAKPVETPVISKEVDTCPICYEDVGEKNSCVTECGHKFCMTCMAKNLQVSAKCPLCRSNIIPDVPAAISPAAPQTARVQPTAVRASSNRDYRAQLHAIVAGNGPYELALRAECAHDVNLFMAKAPRWGITIDVTSRIQEYPFPDVEIHFKSSVPYMIIRRLLRTIVDCHVMVETVLPEEHYTGVRTYGV